MRLASGTGPDAGVTLTLDAAEGQLRVLLKRDDVVLERSSLPGVGSVDTTDVNATQKGKQWENLRFDRNMTERALSARVVT